jgi:hypothetical protein
MRVLVIDDDGATRAILTSTRQAARTRWNGAPRPPASCAACSWIRPAQLIDLFRRVLEPAV